MKKIFATSIILLLFFVNLKAQEIPIDIITRVNNVDYIFEGEILNSQTYQATTSHEIFTSSLINITKILKGNLTCGTVELITHGGINGTNATYSSHTLMPEIGDKGIFLCKNNYLEYPTINLWTVSNPQPLSAYYEDQSFISYTIENNQIIANDILGSFDSISHFYNLAELITGLNFQDCSTNFTNKEQANIPNPPSEETFIPMLLSEFKVTHDWISYQKQNYKRKKKRTNSELTYQFLNPMVTGTSTKYFEFDISIVDNQFVKYLDYLTLRIKYPTSIFDTNIVANNKIQLTRGALIADTNCYSKPIATDFFQDAFLIDISEKVYSQCKAQITNIPNKIVHVKMQMSNCTPNSYLKMEDTLAFGGFAYIMDATYADFPNDTFSTTYDTTFFPSPMMVPNCVATITSFSPDTVRGGVGDTLSIHGFQFGPIQGTGNLFFSNSNTPTSNNYIALDSNDIALWSDTLIKIIVPSVDTGVTFDAIGSCKFRLKNNIGQSDTSDNRVTIFYSLFNGIDPLNSKVPSGLINQKVGGYRFYVDTLVWKNDSMMWCIKKALYEWRCATGVNMYIQKDTFGIPKTATGDYINHIFYNTTLSPTNPARTTNFYDETLNGMQLLVDIDVSISDKPYYPNYYDTLGNVPGNRTDFYAVILHEIGHAVQHKHINDSTAIMYAYQKTITSFGINALNRPIYINNDTSASHGGRREVNLPLNTNAIGAGYTNMTVLPICAGYTYISDLNKEKINLELVPNPVNNYFTIKTNNDIQINSIELYNQTGAKFFTFNNINKQNNNFELPTSIPYGLYYLKISTNYGTFIKKLMHN